VIVPLFFSVLLQPEQVELEHELNGIWHLSEWLID